jgi:hypothetical protein
MAARLSHGANDSRGLSGVKKALKRLLRENAELKRRAQKKDCAFVTIVGPVHHGSDVLRANNYRHAQSSALTSRYVPVIPLSSSDILKPMSGTKTWCS